MPVFVIDNGTGVMKAGRAGEEAPSHVCPAVVGRAKPWKTIEGRKDEFVASKATAHKSLLSLSYPMAHGRVQNWEDLEILWRDTFSSCGISGDPQVLLTEAPMNPLKDRERQAELLFEKFNVASLFVSLQAVLALYASGLTTGLVLDSGDGVTHAVPVHDGFAVTQAITRSDIAGRDVTEHLMTQLRRMGHVFHNVEQKEIIRAVKETECFITLDRPEDEHGTNFDHLDERQAHVLPDGTSILLGCERFRAPEILFQPSMIGSEFSGAHDLLTQAIRRSDMDLRKILYGQIVLSGGSTMFRGYGDRLLKELRKTSPKDVRVRIAAPPERQLSTWLGGSILGSLSLFKDMCVSKSEFKEHGASILSKKFY